MYEWENFYLRKKEHQKHYAQLNQIVADIYAESFYLKKSMKDLNRLTRDSHQLYEDLEAEGIASFVREQKEKTLILEEGGKSNLQSGMKLSYISNIMLKALANIAQMGVEDYYLEYRCEMNVRMRILAK